MSLGIGLLSGADESRQEVRWDATQLRKVFEYGIAEHTHIYDVFLRAALHLKNENRVARIQGNQLQKLKAEYDFGGQDGDAVFGSEGIQWISVGASAQGDVAEIHIQRTGSLHVEITDVPEVYTLTMEENYGFASVHDNRLDQAFGFHGGKSIFSFPFLYFDVLPNNQMLMKLRFLPSSVVDVHPIKRR